MHNNKLNYNHRNHSDDDMVEVLKVVMRSSEEDLVLNITTNYTIEFVNTKLKPILQDHEIRSMLVAIAARKLFMANP